MEIDRDLLSFFGGVALLVLYLFWSAATEMGTKSPRLPWHDRDPDKERDRDEVTETDD